MPLAVVEQRKMELRFKFTYFELRFKVFISRRGSLSEISYEKYAKRKQILFLCSSKTKLVREVNYGTAQVKRDMQFKNAFIVVVHLQEKKIWNLRWGFPSTEHFANCSQVDWRCTFHNYNCHQQFFTNKNAHIFSFRCVCFCKITFNQNSHKKYIIFMVQLHSKQQKEINRYLT